MPVIFDSNKIIPGPFATISKEVERRADGTPTRSQFVITLKGTIVAYMGSPNSSGTFWNASGYPPDESIADISRLKAILAKQGALTELFSRKNKLLEIQPFDGSQPVKAIVRLRNLTFEEGKWYDTCTFNVSFEADTVWFGSTEMTPDNGITDENWSLEQADDRGRTFRLTHTISAAAKASYDIDGTLINPGWKVARDIVLDNNLGIDPEMFNDPNARTLPNCEAYNYVRGQSIDEAGGKYTASESWLLYNPADTDGVPCIEEYTVNVRRSENGQTRVSIEGNLTGLEVRDTTTFELTTDRWTNALARWTLLDPALFGIAEANASITLNPTVLSSSVGKNIHQGTISFNREYDDRPIVFPGAITGTIQTSEKRPLDVFASLVIPGKADGPILQPINTVTAREQRLAIEIVMPTPTMSTPASTKPNTDSIVATYTPMGSSVMKTQDDINWQEHTGRYSRNVAWTYKT